MGLDGALYAGLAGLVAGLASGVGGSLLYGFGLHRRVTRLSLRVNDLEDRALTVKGRNASNKRWDEEEMVKSLLKEPAESKGVRYANDL